MDSGKYLRSYGWKEGEALKKGGIKKPILVKHKKDKKGIGHQPNGSADAWWERLFDGQLKGLDVTQDKSSGVSFKQERVVASSVARSESPLYKMFVRGEILQGTTGKVALATTKIKDGSAMVCDFSMLKTGPKKTNNEEIITSDSSAHDFTPKKYKREKEKTRKEDRDKKESKRGKVDAEKTNLESQNKKDLKDHEAPVEKGPKKGKGKKSKGKKENKHEKRRNKGEKIEKDDENKGNDKVKVKASKKRKSADLEDSKKNKKSKK